MISDIIINVLTALTAIFFMFHRNSDYFAQILTFSPQLACLNITLLSLNNMIKDLKENRPSYSVSISVIILAIRCYKMCFSNGK